MRFGHLLNSWANLLDPWYFERSRSRRRTAEQRRHRITLSLVERLEDRSLLTPPALTLSATPNPVFENAGPGAVQLTITRPSSPEIYVTHNNQLQSYCMDGTQVSSTNVPYGVTPRPGGEVVRDVAFTRANQFVSVYNGTATPYLSRLNTAAANPTWTHVTAAELSTGNTASFGGLAVFNNFVFLTDMNTAGAVGAGLVQFNTTNNTSQRFASTTDYIDVVLGQNNSLYALRSTGVTVDVFDPTSVTLNSTVTLAQAVRAIAVDATGRIFGGASNGMLYRFSAAGVQQLSRVSGVASLTDLDLDAFGAIIAGSTSGTVLVTDSNLTAPTSFSVGNSTTFVAFRRESLEGVTVSLFTSDDTELLVPVSVDFIDGQTTATVPLDVVDDNLLDGTQSVTVSASGPCFASGITVVNVLDYETLTIDITATTMAENAGASTVTGRIIRSNAGFAQTFTLASSDTSEATVPNTVTIATGQGVATFPITAVDDTLLDGTQQVIITAVTPQYILTTDTIQVTDHEILTVAITANSVVENAGAGATTGTVTRGNTDISLPITVTILSSDTTEIADPGLVIIPAGQSSVTFAIDAVDDNILDGTQNVTLTASSVGYVSGSDTLDVTDLENLSITLAAPSVGENAGASATTVRVTRLNTDVSSPLAVVLMSNDTTEATVPLNVIIPSGQTFLNVPVTAVDDNILDGTQTVTISAAALSYQTATVNLNVTDHETVTLSFNPASFLESAGNNASMGTATRNNTDIGTALTVSLLSNDTTEATVPANVIIPAGQASVTFSINAVDDLTADGTQVVTISPSATNYAGVDGTVNVLDNETLTVDIAATSVSESAGASATTVTITRNDGQSATALLVTLLSSDTTEATVQGTVSIPIGSASVTFDLNAVDDTLLDGPQTVTISATAAAYVGGSDTVIVADAPQISNITDQTTNEDTPTAVIPFTLSDIAGDMTITSASSNPTLIPVANIVFGGSGFARTVTITPAANQFGASTITVTAGNALSSVSDTFVVNVTSVNDLPTISDVQNQSTTEDVPAGPITFTIGDVETPAGSLTVTGSSTNQTLVPNANIVLTGTGATRIVTITPAANQSGTVTITLTVRDANGDTATDSFNLAIGTVADTPSVTNATTNEDIQSTTGLVISRNAADGSEVTHFLIAGITGGTLFQNDGATIVGNNSFITTAQGGAGLKFTPSPNSSQPGSFTIRSSLSASTAGLGGNPATATITVIEVNDAPTISDIASLTIREDQGASISFIVGDVETPVSLLQVTATSSNTALVPSNSVVVEGTGTNRTLTITPAANISGVATITVTVNDGSGTASAAVSDTFQLTVTSVPDGPSVTSTGTREDTQTSSGLVISRNPADGPDVTHFKIDRVTGGNVFLNDSVTPVADGGFVPIPQGTLGLRFTPTPNFFGTATFRVRASTSASDTGLGTEAALASIEVEPVADTPSITDGVASQNQQTTSGLVVSRNPVDGLEVTHLYVTNITGGRLYFNNGTTLINNGDFINFTQATAGLKFTPDETSHGQGSFVLQAATQSFIGNIDFNSVTAHITVNGPLTRMYRAYNKIADTHLYTTSRVEFNILVGFGYGDESTNNRGFAMHSTPFQGTVPVFRLYNLKTGIHYYTTDLNERNFLLLQNPVDFPQSQQFGWRDEGIEGFLFAPPQPGAVPVAGTTPIYHLYNVNSGSHLFTESSTQKNEILRLYPKVWREDRILGWAFAFSEQGLVTAANVRRSASVARVPGLFELTSPDSVAATQGTRPSSRLGDELTSDSVGELLSVRERTPFSRAAESHTMAADNAYPTRLNARGTSASVAAPLAGLPGLVDAAWQQFGDQLADW